MAILNFQKPDKVLMIESTDFNGRFEFKPLEPGYGLTVGNALRRVLLSSLDGYAITSLRIEGVEHEFSTIEGVVEVHGTFGAYDILAKVESSQVEALRETITWKIRKIPKIRSTLTLMGIEGQQ